MSYTIKKSKKDSSRLLKNVFEAANASGTPPVPKLAKKRSLQIVNEQSRPHECNECFGSFELIFNEGVATQIVFQRPARICLALDC